MPSLPQNGQPNWGAKLNEFLLVAHNDDGTHSALIDVANVRDYGAGTGDAVIDTAAIQQAVASGQHVYFPNGTYAYNILEFPNPYQRVTCAPDAVLQPAQANSRIRITGGHMRLDNLRVEATGPHIVDRLIEIIAAPGCHFDNLTIVAPHAVEGVYLENLVKCVFVGGEIKGRNSSDKITGSVGLHLGADKSAAPGQYGNTSTFEFRAFGLSVHHWETGVLFSGPSHDDPLFSGCNIEGNPGFGIRFEPEFPDGTSGDPQGTIYNLNLLGCHFEGTEQNIYVSYQGAIKGATISGCRFGSKTKRIIHAQGVLLGVNVVGCYLSALHVDDDMIDELNQRGENRCTNEADLKPRLTHIWEVERLARHCVDMFNHWEDLPDCNFAIGNHGSRVMRFNSESVSGTALDIHGSMRHHGTSLGFFGVEPINRPTGHAGVVADVSTPEATAATLVQAVSALNKLTSDLAGLGLLQK